MARYSLDRGEGGREGREEGGREGRGGEMGGRREGREIKRDKVRKNIIVLLAHSSVIHSFRINSCCPNNALVVQYLTVYCKQ